MARVAPGYYVLPIPEASVNFALTTKVRGTPMRTTRHAFIAIAILGGPASIILAHQKLTQTWPQAASSPVDVTTLVQQAYSRITTSPAICSSRAHHYPTIAAEGGRDLVVHARRMVPNRQAPKDPADGLSGETHQLGVTTNDAVRRLVTVSQSSP
jgi:hypothetical protein